MGYYLSRLQQKLHLHPVERENDFTSIGTVEDAGIQQGRDVTMNRYDIAPHAAGCFTD